MVIKKHLPVFFDFYAGSSSLFFLRLKNIQKIIPAIVNTNNMIAITPIIFLQFHQETFSTLNVGIAAFIDFVVNWVGCSISLYVP